MRATRIGSFLLIAAFVFAPLGAVAQHMISLGGKSCTSGLEALASVVGVQLQAPGGVRKTGGECRAASVGVEGLKRGMRLHIGKVIWQAGALAPLAQRKMPARLRLRFYDVRLEGAPQSDAALHYLQMVAGQGRGMQAMLDLTYAPETQELLLTEATLDFPGDSRAVLRAHLAGVSPNLPVAPAAGLMAASIRRLSLGIAGGALSHNKAAGLLAAAVKSSARTRAQAVFEAAGLGPARAFLEDLPKPAGDVNISLEAPDGFAMLRLVGLGAIFARDKTPEPGEMETLLAGAKLAAQYETR